MKKAKKAPHLKKPAAKKPVRAADPKIAARARAPKLTVVNRSTYTTPRAFLKSWVTEMSTQLTKETKHRNFNGKELVIAFLDEREARKLNKTYRDRDYATDVLSFSADPNDDLIGELVICPQVIKRQAKEHGLTMEEELGYMVLHGFLHLLGYDHETSKKAAKEMLTLQDRVFERLLAKA